MTEVSPTFSEVEDRVAADRSPQGAPVDSPETQSDPVDDERDPTPEPLVDETQTVPYAEPKSESVTLSREEWDRIREYLDRSGQEVPVGVQTDTDKEEYYIHLANGDVERVKGSELPPYAGTNSQFGYHEKDGSVHTVIGVYPVETEIKKEEAR